MGGLGSGTWIRPNRRRKIEETPYLDMASLRRRLIIIPENWGGGGVNWYNPYTGNLFMRVQVWSYAHDPENRLIRVQHTDGDGRDHSWPIRVAVTHPPYGGIRFWFICPLCKEQRCAKLYFSDRQFGCRDCHGLVHDTSQRGKERRLWDQYHKLNKSLGSDADLDRGLYPSKPKGMHTTTYEERLEKLERYYNEAKARMDSICIPAVLRNAMKMYEYNGLFDDEFKMPLN